MFHLDEMKETTLSSVEIKKALEHRYKITKIHAALAYENMMD